MAPNPWDEAEEAMGSVERQARRDQIEGEVEARQLHLASRTLFDVAWEAMQQGHRLRLAWSGGEARGTPTAVIEDLVLLPVDQGVQAINLSAVATVEVTERRTARGSSGDRTLGSFVAFCRMAEGGTVSCEVVGGRRIEGILAATATDHLLMRTGTGDEIAVARSQVAALSVAGDFPFSL